MWDEKDYMGRWIQGICGIFLLLLAAATAYFLFRSTFMLAYFGGIALLLFCCRVGWRSLRYAITGRNNINRDSY